jgi:hypothetical protein
VKKEAALFQDRTRGIDVKERENERVVKRNKEGEREKGGRS